MHVIVAVVIHCQQHLQLQPSTGAMLESVRSLVQPPWQHCHSLGNLGLQNLKSPIQGLTCWSAKCPKRKHKKYELQLN